MVARRLEGNLGKEVMMMSVDQLNHRHVLCERCGYWFEDDEAVFKIAMSSS